MWYYQEADCYVPDDIEAITSLNHNTHYKDGSEEEMFYEIPDYTIDEYHSTFCERQADGRWVYTA